MSRHHYHRSHTPMLMGDDAASPAVVDAATPTTTTDSTPLLEEPIVKAAISGVAIFHGYRRTGSVLWALAYGLSARVAPVVTGAVVVAQGFGQKKGA